MQPENEKTYSLSLSGEGMKIEREIDQHTALKIVHAILGGGGQASANGGTIHNPAPLEVSALSLREYLDQIGASQKPQQIATIANYIIEYEKQPDFERDDIRSRFMSAKEPLPANFPRDFSIAVQKGWIAEVHGKRNRFYVTAKGTQAIERGFSEARR